MNRFDDAKDKAEEFIGKAQEKFGGQHESRGDDSRGESQYGSQEESGGGSQFGGSQGESQYGSQGESRPGSQGESEYGEQGDSTSSNVDELRDRASGAAQNAEERFR